MDIALLKYEMEKRSITKDMMCKHLGLSRSAFYRKCNGISEFTYGEMMNIADLLGIDAAIQIFFNKKVS